MKKNSLIISVLIVCVTVIGMFSAQAESLVETIGLNKIKRKAVLCKQLGLYPVFTYKKDRKSSFYVTPFAPVTAQAIADMNAKQKNGELKGILFAKKAKIKPSTVDIQAKHQEKTVKLDSSEYATALWETIKNSAKLYDVTDTAYTAATQFEITTNGLTYTFTLGDGVAKKTKFGTDSGRCTIEDQYWPGVTNKGPDGKIKNDVKATIIWKPGSVKAKLTLKGPRNLAFIANNTTTTDPTTSNDGSIDVTVNYSIAITNNGTTETWALGDTTSSGKKKTKVQSKKTSLNTAGKALYVLVNWNSKLKKAELTKQ